MGVIKILETPIAIMPNQKIATLQVLTAKQAEDLFPLQPDDIYALISKPEKFEKSITGINNVSEMPNEFEEGGATDFWFPTPETCENPKALTGISKTIYETQLEIEELEKNNPLSSPEDRIKFLSQFSSKSSQPTKAQISKVEDLLVDYHNTFARHRLDADLNKDFKIKLSPEHDRPVFSQSPPMPINDKDEMLIKLALMQY